MQIRPAGGPIRARIAELSQRSFNAKHKQAGAVVEFSNDNINNNNNNNVNRGTHVRYKRYMRLNRLRYKRILYSTLPEVVFMSDVTCLYVQHLILYLKQKL